VKVTRTEIFTDDEYDYTVLEKNFFSKPKSFFCLVQQVSPEDIQKYFVFGMKFEDFYVTPCKTKAHKDDKKNYVNVFTYEKTYLFISFKPMLKLFQTIFKSILNVKKINFLNNMSDFSCIFVKSKWGQFIEENSEKVGHFNYYLFRKESKSMKFSIIVTIENFLYFKKLLLLNLI
jgi:hypothetical protein